VAGPSISEIKKGRSPGGIAIGEPQGEGAVGGRLSKIGKKTAAENGGFGPSRGEGLSWIVFFLRQGKNAIKGEGTKEQCLVL